MLCGLGVWFPSDSGFGVIFLAARTLEPDSVERTSSRRAEAGAGRLAARVRVLGLSIHRYQSFIFFPF